MLRIQSHAEFPSLVPRTNGIEITENFSVNRIAQQATLIPSSKSTLYCHAKQTVRISVRNKIQNDCLEHLKTLFFCMALVSTRR